MLALGPSGLRWLRLAGFDAYQMLAPRQRATAPVLIVAVDEASLDRHGQWPWPRTLLARLLSRIGEADPAAIGLDILMPEPDRLSPDRLPDLVQGMEREVVERLARMPTNDGTLAETLRALPAVLGVGGLDTAESPAARPALREPTLRLVGGDPIPFLRRYGSVIRSVDEIHAAARAHGLLSADTEAGVVRRLPLLAAVGRTPVPGLGVEMLRVATRTPALTLRVGRGGLEAVGIGDVTARSEPDGSAWLHFSPHDPARFVSAVDLLAGAIEPARLRGKLVLVGVTALGLSDYQATPLGDRMSGVEIHAQLLEGLVDGTLLSRPAWTRWLESGLLLAGGLGLVLLVPGLPVGRSVLVGLGAVAAVLGVGIALFVGAGILVDAVAPAMGLAGLFTAMLGLTLAEADSQRSSLRRQVERQREAAARVAGELEAARRIQMGSLPSPASAFPGERRFSLYTFLEPAQEVGGDLYDFFRLDEDRLVFLVGDVSGKGLPGSLFMAVSKSLYKSTALRRRGQVAAMMREANVEISRDNTELLFVTLFAGILDARMGVLEYCNAGHDDPWLLPHGERGLERLSGGGGPPLCVLEEFPYLAATRQMEPGETLCLVTDGVTEARGKSGELYGRKRLEALLAGLGTGAGPETVGHAIRTDVAGFTEGVEPADDVTIMVLRWNGPGGAPGAPAAAGPGAAVSGR
ncbi:MAG: CHASE2 domain-containing protein [Candidatus Rokubacteria bacterium]|nr:CHASE2 domain-containing protein [Candidatus Rokubacteria bacterium]